MRLDRETPSCTRYLSHMSPPPPPNVPLSRPLGYASGHHYPESFSYSHIIIITLTCPPPPPSNVPLSRSLGYASGHHYPGCHDRPGLPAFRETKRFEKGVRGDPPSALSICTPTYITSFKKVIRSNIHNPLYVYHLNHSMHVSVVSVNPQSPPHPPPPTHPFTLRAPSHHRISIPIVCRISYTTTRRTATNCWRCLWPRHYWNTPYPPPQSLSQRGCVHATFR